MDDSDSGASSGLVRDAVRVSRLEMESKKQRIEAKRTKLNKSEKKTREREKPNISDAVMDDSDSGVSSGLVRDAVRVSRFEMESKKQRIEVKRTKLNKSEKKTREREKPNINACCDSGEEKQSARPEQGKELQYLAEKQSPRAKMLRAAEMDISPAGAGGVLPLQMAATKKQAERGQIWSRKDEIGMLKGLIEVKNAGGDVDKVSYDRFLELMQGRFDIDFSKTQIQDKIIRMRKKFRRKMKSEAALRPRGHDSEFFRLSRKLWGKRLFSPNSILDMYWAPHGMSGTCSYLRDKVLVSEGYKLLNESSRSELEEKGRKIECQMQELRTASTELYNQLIELTVNALIEINH